MAFYLFFFPVNNTEAGEFKLARAKFDVEELSSQSIDGDDGLWDIGIQKGVDPVCERLLAYLEPMLSFKIDKKVHFVDFKDINKLSDYPFIFMHASYTIKLSKQEKDNMREYLKRGGFIFAEDCAYHSIGVKKIPTPAYMRKYRFVGDLFFTSFKKLMENEIFPGKKMELLPPNHAIYHCFYSLPNGLPYMQGYPHGGYGLSDDKGQLMVFLSSNDIHCSWQETFFTEEKHKEGVEMVANLIVYVFTH